MAGFVLAALIVARVSRLGALIMLVLVVALVILGTDHSIQD